MEHFPKRLREGHLVTGRKIRIHTRLLLRMDYLPETCRILVTSWFFNLLERYQVTFSRNIDLLLSVRMFLEACFIFSSWHHTSFCPVLLFLKVVVLVLWLRFRRRSADLCGRSCFGALQQLCNLPTYLLLGRKLSHRIRTVLQPDPSSVDAALFREAFPFPLSRLMDRM